MSDDECEAPEQLSTPLDIDSWRYQPPPQVQGTFFFKEDGLLFDSSFDSGNLMDVERVAAKQYNLFIAPDCAQTPKQTSNKQWFHFSICGGKKGDTIYLTFVNIPCCKMYSFPGYAPAVAIIPQRPSYNRLSTKMHIRKLDPPPVTSPAAVMSSPGSQASPSSGSLLNFEGGTPTTPSAGPTKKTATMCNMTFEYTFEFDSVLKVDPTSPTSGGSMLGVAGNPSMYSSGVFIANAQPYSYSKLQKHLAQWDSAINSPLPCTRIDSNSSSSSASLPRASSFAGRRGSGAAAGGGSSGNGAGDDIYFHRELLTYSLDRNRCDLVTISGSTGMLPLSAAGAGGDSSSTAGDDSLYEPMLDAEIPVPPPLAGNVSQLNADPTNAKHCCSKTGRARVFPKKRYVVFSARVHPGEIPASHILHGAIEFLLSKDPRAIELRNHFVFVIVPMINPDGVVRGQSRADTTGQNLNRTYANPCPKRHPTTSALRKLLLQLQSTSRLALYVDLHAHANKRGVFFYGNGMKAADQIHNMLYAKLVSMNSPYFEFHSCNFSEQNMFAVGKNGEGKDSSSRVVLYKETGFVHSYTLEANYVIGTTLNDVKGLGQQFIGEESGTSEGTPCPKYALHAFYDVGRSLCVSAADFYGVNPASRLPLTSFHNLRGVALWIQRALIVDAWEQLRKQQIMQTGQSLSRDREKPLPTFSTMAAAQFPPVVTTKATKTFPPTTVLDLTGAVKGMPLNEDPVVGVSKPPSAASRTAAARRATNNTTGIGGGTKRKASIPSTRGIRTARSTFK